MNHVFYPPPSLSSKSTEFAESEGGVLSAFRAERKTHLLPPIESFKRMLSKD